MLLVPVAIAMGIGLFASIKILKDKQHNRGLTVRLNVSSNSSASSNSKYIPIGLKDVDDETVARNISLVINGINYLFSLPAEDKRGSDKNASLTIHDLAIEFCQLRGSDLGFTLKTFSQCVNPSKHKSTNQSNQYINICLCIYPSIHLSFFLSILNFII